MIKNKSFLKFKNILISDNETYIINSVKKLDFFEFNQVFLFFTMHDKRNIINQLILDDKIDYSFSGFELLHFAIQNSNYNIIKIICNNDKFIKYQERFSDLNYLEELSKNKDFKNIEIIFNSKIKHKKSDIIYAYQCAVNNNNVELFKYLIINFKFLHKSKKAFNFLSNGENEIIETFIKIYPEHKTSDLFLLNVIFAKKKKFLFEASLKLFDFSNNTPNFINHSLLDVKHYKMYFKFITHYIYSGYSLEPILNKIDKSKISKRKEKIELIYQDYISQKISYF